MSKIYVVESEWVYTDFYEGGGDCVDKYVEKIFDTEEKAVNYIREKVRTILEAAAVDPHYDIEDFIDSVPSIDEILKEKSIKYYSDSHTESTFSYIDYEVE